jgi:hypothetical protein
MKRILKFNESILPHEITDYFLHFTEVEGFKYTPSGSLIKLYYSGIPKDISKIMIRYNELSERLKTRYEIESKSIKISDLREIQDIEITIQLSKVEDFKIEFEAFYRKVSGDIISAQLIAPNGSINTPNGISSIIITLANLTNMSSKRLFLHFEFRGAYGCHKTSSLGSDGDSILKIDSKNIQKILDAIKSNNVKNDCNLEAFMPYLEELNPTDMSK